MVDINRICQSFQQIGNTCVLASHAVAANYFTGLPVGDLFMDYCSHFGLRVSNVNEAQLQYDAHFHGAISRRGICGYALILDLYINSKWPSFQRCRASYIAGFCDNTLSAISSYETLLKNHEALANITFETNGHYHSITVGYSGTSFFAVDTAKPAGNQITNYASFADIRAKLVSPNVANLRDSLLCLKIA